MELTKVLASASQMLGLELFTVMPGTLIFKIVTSLLDSLENKNLLRIYNVRLCLVNLKFKKSDEEGEVATKAHLLDSVVIANT